jgi:hypothetical protein
MVEYYYKVFQAHNNIGDLDAVEAVKDRLPKRGQDRLKSQDQNAEAVKDLKSQDRQDQNAEAIKDRLPQRGQDQNAEVIKDLKSQNRLKSQDQSAEAISID